MRGLESYMKEGVESNFDGIKNNTTLKEGHEFVNTPFIFSPFQIGYTMLKSRNDAITYTLDYGIGFTDRICKMVGI